MRQDALSNVAVAIKKPFYRLSTCDVTHVRKCTRPSPTLPHCKRREAGQGPGNKARREGRMRRKEGGGVREGKERERGAREGEGREEERQEKEGVYSDC